MIFSCLKWEWPKKLMFTCLKALQETKEVVIGHSMSTNVLLHAHQLSNAKVGAHSRKRDIDFGIYITSPKAHAHIYHLHIVYKSLTRLYITCPIDLLQNEANGLYRININSS